MKKLVLVLLFALTITGCGSRTEPAPTLLPSECDGAPVEQVMVPDENFQKDTLVNGADYLPGVIVELKYAGEDNFTGQAIYGFREAYLRWGTVQKLIPVCQALEARGLRLKIWDAFRPLSAQQALWEVCPDPAFVSHPQTGKRGHSRGSTLDVTLTDDEGRELTMPTGFDDFSPLADRDYSDCGEEAAENARLLQEIMEQNGFTGYQKEWWHFSDTDDYPVEEHFDPAVISRWYADCEEFISLRSAPDTGAPVITRIPAGEEFTVLGWAGDFAYADYIGQRGYVLTGYIQPAESQRNELG